MPLGQPYNIEQRKIRHEAKYGTLSSFPQARKGIGTYWTEDQTKIAMYVLGGALVGGLVGYFLGKRK